MRPIHLYACALLISGIVISPAAAQSQYQIDQRNAEYETEKAKKAAARAQEDARRANARVAEIEAYLIEKERQEQAARQQAADAAALAEAQRRQQELARQQAEYKAANEARVKAARDREMSARLSRGPLPSTTLTATSVMMRRQSDGRYLVIIGTDRQIFATEAEALAFIAQRKK